MSKTKKSVVAGDSAPKRSRSLPAERLIPKPDSAAAAAESLSFEGALEQLEDTVGRLEEGEMPLEEALELFEAGVRLSRQCTTTLETAEKRIEILVADRGQDVGLKSEPFETDALEDDEDFDED
jgi:exodeoxyribonuclease VII small subunit